jgi:hypothetical protein
MASGLVMLIASFLAFYKVDAGDFGEDKTWSGWSNVLNLFPLIPILVVLGVIVCAQPALRRFANVQMPERIAVFSWNELRLSVGGLGALTGLCFLIRGFEGSPIDKGIGLWLMTLAMIALVVGAVMERAETSGTALTAEPRREPTPADMVILGAGVVILIASFLPVLGGDESRSAWGSVLFPLYVIPVLLGVIMAGQTALALFTSASVPGGILGIEWRRLGLILGGFAALVMICFLIGDAGFNVGDSPDKKVGFWLELLAALGLAAGAFMRLQETNRPAAPAAQAASGNPPPPPPPPPR